MRNICLRFWVATYMPVMTTVYRTAGVSNLLVMLCLSNIAVNQHAKLGPHILYTTTTETH
jgi:hypothetical protein